MVSQLTSFAEMAVHRWVFRKIVTLCRYSSVLILLIDIPWACDLPKAEIAVSDHQAHLRTVVVGHHVRFQ
jgi:hypothetical protein